MDAGNMNSTLSIIEGTRAQVPTAAFCFDTFPGHIANTVQEREYSLAAAYLVSNGTDVYGDFNYWGNSDWVGYHVDLGAPTSGRTLISGATGAWKRTFASGMVLFNAQTTSVATALPAGTWRKLDGTAISGNITLAARTGLVLIASAGTNGTITVGTPVAPPTTVNLNTDTTLGTARDWRKWSSANWTQFATRNSAPMLIGALMTQGTATIGTFTSTATTWTWTNAKTGTGVPTSPSNVGAAVTGSGNGWKFTLPTYEGETRTIKLYVGVRGVGTIATMAANFGTSGAVTKVINGTSDTTMIDRVITLTAKPNLPTDTLTLKWLHTGGTSAQARVVLYAVQVF